MKVSAEFNIDEDEMLVRSEKGGKAGDYWATAAAFYQDVKDKDLEDCTPRQLDWLQKIEEGLKL